MKREYAILPRKPINRQYLGLGHPQGENRVGARAFVIHSSGRSRLLFISQLQPKLGRRQGEGSGLQIAAARAN